MKYINAEKLKETINKQLQENADKACLFGAAFAGRAAEDNDIINLIDSLQQEQPEVDLEKFISDFIDKKDSENQGKWCEEDIIEAMKSSFALGLNARKI